jgi:hypothetical protein
MDHLATSIEVHGPIRAARILSATQVAIEFEDGYQTATPVPAAFVEGAVQAVTLETNGSLRLRFASGHERVENFPTQGGVGGGDSIAAEATPA